MTPTLTRKVRLADIVTLAARVWNVPEDAIKGKGHRRTMVLARAAVVAVARSMPCCPSYPQIGRHLGRDHTTAINSFKQIGEYMRFAGFSEKLAELFHLCEITDPFVKEREQARAMMERHERRRASKRAQNQRAKLQGASDVREPIVFRPAKKPRNVFASEELALTNKAMRIGSAMLADAIRAARIAA